METGLTGVEIESLAEVAQAAEAGLLGLLTNFHSLLGTVGFRQCAVVLFLLNFPGQL